MTDDTELPKEIEAKLRELVAKLEIAENERDAYQCRSGKLEAELAAMRFPPQSMNSSILDRINAVREARAAAYEEAAKVADLNYHSTPVGIAVKIRQLAAAESEGPSPCPICGFWPYECKCKTWDYGPWVDRSGRLHEVQTDGFSGCRCAECGLIMKDRNHECPDVSDSFSFREFL